MRRRGAHGRLTSADRLELRLRVAAGERYEAAAAAVGCSTRSVQRVLAASGGVPPRTKPRSRLRLSLAEREEISRGLLEGASCRAIASRLGRAPSTVTREVSGNGGRTTYRAWRAEDRAVEQACRPKVPKLVRSARLRRIVERRLAECWSPQQIAHRLVADHPDDPKLRVSHETIYQSLFVQARGALRKELTRFLRTGRTQRRPHPTGAGNSGQLWMPPATIGSSRLSHTSNVSADRSI